MNKKFSGEAIFFLIITPFILFYNFDIWLNDQKYFSFLEENYIYPLNDKWFLTANLLPLIFKVADFFFPNEKIGALWLYPIILFFFFTIYRSLFI